MQIVSVKVESDHLLALTHATSPVLAIAELIWNGLDADAARVTVRLPLNPLGAVESVCVTDDGTGLPHDDAIEAFQSLGGSLKRGIVRTASGRQLHGKLGRGRFRAFAIGEFVTWSTRYRKDGAVLEYDIRGRRADIKTFEIDDPVATSGKPGTDVVICDLPTPVPALASDSSRQKLTEHFAIYLRQYPQVVLEYDGSRIDPSSVEDRSVEYNIGPIVLEGGREVEATLVVVEWTVPTDRTIFLCDTDGFTLAQTPPRIHAPGFQFTAYLRSDYLRELHETGLLGLDELHPGLSAVLETARAGLRDHFRRRLAEAASHLLEDWKREEVYPYQGNPVGQIEEVERQVFDVLALNVHSYLPDFGDAAQKTKRLTLRLLKEAIEAGPSVAQRIIQEVLDLPAEKQSELVELLEHTSLEAMINAAKTVGSRLDFLGGLERLVFEPKSKKELLERSQLHRIVADHTWVFGESFNLSVDDQSLTEVLRKHMAALGRDVSFMDDAPVLRQDGSRGIVDLMLSRKIPQPNPTLREHLVVELKRPTVRIGDEESTQLKRYAHAVAADERFRDTGTRWVFWAVSNEMKDSVRREATQRNRPFGLLYEDQEGLLTVWVRTWGQIINESRARLEFYQRELQYRSDADSAIAYLKKLHSKYLPPSLS